MIIKDASVLIVERIALIYKLKLIQRLMNYQKIPISVATNTHQQTSTIVIMTFPNLVSENLFNFSFSILSSSIHPPPLIKQNSSILTKNESPKLYSISEYINISKLIQTFYGEHQYPKVLKSHTPIGVSNGRAKHDPLDSPSIEDKSSKNARYFVIYRVETQRAISQALLGFVIFKVYGGSRVSNPLTLLSECDTPIFYKVETLGGSNGYIS